MEETPQFFAENRSRKRNAFTLTELAIVIGVIGLILGAIWTVSVKVSANRKAARATQEVLVLAESIRGVYGPKHAVDDGDLTQFAVNSSMYLPDMIQPISCDTIAHSGASVSPCPVHPWNGEMTVGGGSYGCNNGTGTCPTNNFAIILYGLTASQCVNFLGTFIPQAVNNGFYAINYAGVGSTPVDASTALDSAAIQNCAGAVDLQFHL
jgi:hypothetical protein